IPGVGLEHAVSGQTRIPIQEIDAGERILDVRTRVAFRHDDANRRLADDVGFRADDREVVRCDGTQPVLTNRQRSDLEAADTAAGPAADFEVHDLAGRRKADAPREEGAAVLLLGAADRTVAVLSADAAELEDVRLSEEKVALLREEQVEPRE